MEIDWGMRIARSEQQKEKAFASICVSFEPDSKVNDESDVQL
jgi:hypothetical protein